MLSALLSTLVEKAMIAMARNPAYIESEKHRAAGLAGQLLIEVSEQGFGF